MVYLDLDSFVFTVLSRKEQKFKVAEKGPQG